jgi:tetratricopeptide (TPR) repeat protein
VAGARRAAEAAVAAWPGSPLLWRILVSLSEADLATVIRARQACPADAELWLAEIVVRSRQKMEGDRPSRAFAVWVEAEIARVAAADAFSAGAVTRAGEYLARGGMTKAAAVAARDAAARSRGLLPASALAIHCALRTQDKDWALAATRQALREAIDPGPMLYKIMAELRGANASAPLDDDMVATLKRLRRSEPNNALWAEMLTYVLFHRESWSELMNCLGEARAALDAGSKKRAIFLLGAEAARQQQLIDQAAEILKKGLAAYPGDTALLNNLAYTLAQDPSTVGEAQKLIPQLAVLAEKEPQIIDTIASVWLRGGKAKEAEPWVQQLERFAKDQPRWRARACLHRAGIAVLRGDPAEAQRLCRILLADTRKVTNEDVVTANQILYEADAAALKARQLPGGR